VSSEFFLEEPDGTPMKNSNVSNLTLEVLYDTAYYLKQNRDKI
jgi:hypothetical protein